MTENKYRVSNVSTNITKPITGDWITRDQLHAMLLNNRNNVYAQRNNYQEWHVEYYSVDYRYYNNVVGIMFDINSFAINTNYCYREACATFWPELKLWFDKDITEAEKGLCYTMCHEIGHCFNLPEAPSGSIGTDGIFRQKIMGYGLPRSDVHGFLIGHDLFNWGQDYIDFYQKGPESWVKPGRYGVHFASVTEIPYYEPYQSLPVYLYLNKIRW